MKKNKKIFVLIFAALLVLQCSIMKHVPYCSLKDVNFSISPHIIKKEGDYFLEYQIAVNSDKIEQRLQVESFISGEKLYYYFIGKTSFRELGNVVQKPLQGNTMDFVKKDAIYWINSDNTEIKLEIAPIPHEE